jgi:membrane-associated HD superfamily phosphohydrolase
MRDNICVFFADRKDKEQLRTQIGDILSSVFPLGVVNETTIVEFGPGVKFIKIVNPLVKAERLYKSKDVLTLNKAIDICKEYAARMFSRDIRLRNYATDLITALVKENVVYDKEETEKLRNEATKAVKPVYNMVEVKKNELIMEKGQRVTERHIVQLVQLGIIGGAMSRGAYLSGMTILLTIFLFLSILYLNTSDKKLVRSPKEVLIILLNCILILVVAQFVIQSPQPSYIIPIAGDLNAHSAPGER